MIIVVTVKPQSKKNEVIHVSDDEYIVKTTAPALDGKANIAVIGLLAEYLGIKKSQITITRGIKLRTKQFEVSKNS